MGTRKNRLNEAVLMCTRNICFNEAVLMCTRNICFEEKNMKIVKNIQLAVYRRGDSNTHPQHIILWRILKIINFNHFDFDSRFPQFLLYVRWKSGANFVRRCFRDVQVYRRHPL